MADIFSRSKRSEVMSRIRSLPHFHSRESGNLPTIKAELFSDTALQNS